MHVFLPTAQKDLQTTTDSAVQLTKVVTFCLKKQENILSMKKIASLLLVVFCLSLVGCSKDADVEAFMTENNSVIKEIVSKIEANPSEAGVDEAQKVLDARKAGLTDKWTAIKSARGVQVSEAVTKKLEESMKNDMKLLTDVTQKHGMKLAQSGKAMDKFMSLLKSYQAIITM
jgi:hypothetical protein